MAITTPGLVESLSSWVKLFHALTTSSLIESTTSSADVDREAAPGQVTSTTSSINFLSIAVAGVARGPTKMTKMREENSLSLRLITKEIFPLDRLLSSTNRS